MSDQLISDRTQMMRGASDLKKTAIATLLVLIPFSAHSQQQLTVAPGSDNSATGTINGRVVSESGQPLLGATVNVRRAGPATQARTTVTDSEGNFKVSNLDSAVYRVSAWLPAYTTTPRDPDDPANYYRPGDSVRLELIRGGVITGTVTTVAGEPVVAVRVRAYLVRDAEGQTPGGAITSFGEGSTDDRGVYRIYGLVPGTYLVYAGGGSSSGYWLDAYGSDAPTYAPSSTRNNAAEIIVRGGEESGVDIRYRGEPGHSVSGTVKSQGTNSVNLNLVPVGSGFMPAGNSYLPSGGRGFAFTGIADGDYDLVAQETVSPRAVSPQAVSFPEMAFSEPRRITVKGADISGIELTTKPLASISGGIALEPSKAPECKGKRQPLFSETLVTLQRNGTAPDRDQSQYLRLYANPASPDKEGAFVLRNVLTDQYTFNLRFFAHYWYLQSISLANPPAGVVAKSVQTNQRVDAAGNWTTVKFGDRIAGLTITLAEGAATLRGRVTVPEGSSLPPGLSVYLVPTEREKASDVLRFFIAAVAFDGSFALTNIPPGLYWSIAKPATVDEATTSKLRLPSAEDSRLKLRREAETTKLETELKPCVNVTDYQVPFRSH
jgi:hypothetical protein